METYWIEDGPNAKTFGGYSIILPSLSIANIGQLAIDVLISTLNAQQIAILNHPALLPIAGSNAYLDSESGLTTSADLHVVHKHKLLIVQIRSPYAKGRRIEFVSALLNLVFDLNPEGDGKLIVLAGCHAANRRDFQMKEGNLRYYPSSKFSESEALQKLKSVGPPQLEEVPDSSGENKPYFCMSGYSEDIVNNSSLATVCLISYVDEGDNTHDAVQLAAYFYAGIICDNSDQKKEVKWRVPPSWKNMFGAPTPRSLFM